MFAGWKDWVRGWVEWEAQGGGAEQLLCAAQQNGIELWKVRRQDITLRARCWARQYKRLRRPARRSGMRMRVRAKHGLPFRLFRYRARVGLAVGLVLGAYILSLLSGRVWSIEVHGVDRAQSAAVLQALEPLGLRQGSRFPEQGITQLQAQAMQRLPQLAFISFQLSGSCVRISVRERQAQQPETVSYPSDLIAVRDGLIRRVVTAAGTAYVGQGDAVQAGQMLISGIREEKYGTHLLQAKGEVWAQTEREFCFSAALSERVTEAQGEIRYLPQLRIFGWSIPLYQSGALPPQYQAQSVQSQWSLLGKSLPLGFWCQRVYLPTIRTVTRSREQADAYNAQQWEEQCAVLREQGVTVLQATKRIEQQADRQTLTVRCICLENIAVSKKLTSIRR